MVSNHYPLTYGHAWNWAILAAIAVIGAGTRHWFNLRNQGRRNAWILPAAALGMVALAFATAPRAAPDRPAVGSDAAEASFAEVRVIIARRCLSCHSESPTDPAFTAAPAGVALDTPEQIRRQAERMYAMTVASQVMPPGNLTGMTGAERELLGQWIRQGAKIK